MKHSLFRHTISGSIDFINRSWKVGAHGLKERSPHRGRNRSSSTDSTEDERERPSSSDEKIHPFNNRNIQPSDIKILKELGTGGSATVHLISYRDDEQYAMKVINLDDEKIEYKSAQSEIETLRSLESPHVIKMIQCYIRNRRIAIILEYMNASTLEDACKKCIKHRSSRTVSSTGMCKLDLLASITYQIVHGLNAMHKHRICHRDIKPSNILLHSYNSIDGKVAVTDFGLAKILSENELCTEIVGTTKYHSPERIQYMGYDYSCDIWSLGTTVLELYLGYYPFSQVLEGDDEDAFRKYICSDPLGDICDGIPDDLLHFVSACLSQDPEDRPTAEDLFSYSFVKRASKDSSCRRIGEWIEDNNLKQAKVSNPISINAETPAKRRRASVAQQFFSASSGSDRLIPMSVGSNLQLSGEDSATEHDSPAFVEPSSTGSPDDGEAFGCFFQQEQEDFLGFSFEG